MCGTRQDAEPAPCAVRPVSQIENLAGYNDLKPAEQAQVQQAVNPAGAGSVKADSDKPAAPSRAQRATRASSRKSDSDAPTVEQQPEEVKEESAGSEDTKEGTLMPDALVTERSMQRTSTQLNMTCCRTPSNCMFVYLHVPFAVLCAHRQC